MLNLALKSMLDRYNCRTASEYVHALREIQQELILLGLWRSKFFEHAAFYGGTALRILYGLDRFSEDLDFSLLHPDPDFKLDAYARAACQEIEAFGFKVFLEQVKTTKVIHSAFIKGETIQHLLVIQAEDEVRKAIPGGKLLKIKLEVDTDPPSGFFTESRYLFLPIPFAVRSYTLPDLFAGKMHALLCRRWKNRVKGRDWYDFVWYVGHHPELRLSHLEQRLRQSNDWLKEEKLTPALFDELMIQAIDDLDVDKARQEVQPFVRNEESIAIWSREFFKQAAMRIRVV